MPTNQESGFDFNVFTFKPCDSSWIRGKRLKASAAVSAVATDKAGGLLVADDVGTPSGD